MTEMVKETIWGSISRFSDRVCRKLYVVVKHSNITP